MKKALLIFLAVLSLSLTGYTQQNNLLNTYSFDLMQLNVAAAGTNRTEINLNYRNQWATAKDNPTAVQLNASVGLGRNTGIGMRFIQQNLGLLGFTTLTGAYSYKLRFNENTFVQLGVGLSWQQNSLRSDAAVVLDQDPTLQGSRNRVQNFDVETGAVLNSGRMKLGVGASNIYNTNRSEGQFSYMIQPQLNAFATYRIYESARWSIDPWIVYRINAGGRQQMEGMLHATFSKHFLVGAGYRSSYGILALAGFRKSNFGVYYSYDYYTATQKVNYGSSHQLMLSYVIERKKQSVPSPVADKPVVTEKISEDKDPIVKEEPQPVTKPEPVREPVKPVITEEQLIARKLDSINKLSESIVFEVGKTTLSADKAPLLDEVALILKTYPSMLVDLEGYASKGGSPELNKKLSEQRATYVKQELIKRGVGASQFRSVRALGVATLTTNENYNRTVRFKAVNK